jgi:hypothetical protein
VSFGEVVFDGGDECGPFYVCVGDFEFCCHFVYFLS